MTRRGRAVRLTAACVVALGLAAAAPAGGGTPPTEPTSHPRLDPNLAAAPHESPGRIAVEIYGFERQVPLDVVRRFGATDVVTAGDVVLATLPADALAALADHGAVRWVRPVTRPVADAITGQGVGLTEAGDWHSAGITGSGVKVAVIDTGFWGYTARKASGDLPTSLTTVNYCDDFSGSTASEHGTAVAEIVYDMAPGAELYLLCVDSAADLVLAVEWAIDNGIDVINQSLSWYPPGRGDGSGVLEPILAAAYASGIVWVNSAGNSGTGHWGGTFVDRDADSLLDFSGDWYTPDEKNVFELLEDEEIFVVLRWDEWPASANDFKVNLYREAGDVPLASSTQTQTGTQEPLDWFTFTSTYGDYEVFYITVQRISGAGTPVMDLFVTAFDPLENGLKIRSVNDPATSPFVTAVGAINQIRWSQSDPIQQYSSWGPTIDGRNKPEITGPDCVDTATYPWYSWFDLSGFCGTSASAPHVAGAAALLLDAAPCLGVAEVNALLASLAVDAGDPGTDFVYGAGKLSLGVPATVADTTGCVVRVAGPNRYATAAAVAAHDFPDPATTVFVATGVNFPDGLAGAAVAGRLGGPLLLVDGSGVPSDTAAELTRLDPDEIVILGGPGVIPDSVATTLGGYAPTVTRIFGADRYETAVAISQYGFPTPGTADTVFVATGLNFPDALAASAAAAELGGPVLLVPGVEIPAAVADEILRLSPGTIVVVGGTGAVSEEVFLELDLLQPDDALIRISGQDRYLTSVAISSHAFPAGAARAYVATGLGFPDALAGGAAAGSQGAPVLLIPGTSVPAAVSTEIDHLGADLVVVLGGTTAVTAAVERALEDGLA